MCKMDFAYSEMLKKTRKCVYETLCPNYMLSCKQIISQIPKVIQVIYTLDTISEPNTMTLAQAVLTSFHWFIWIKREKGDNSVMV